MSVLVDLGVAGHTSARKPREPHPPLRRNRPQVIPVDTLLRMRAAELLANGQSIPRLRSSGADAAVAPAAGDAPAAAAVDAPAADSGDEAAGDEDDGADPEGSPDDDGAASALPSANAGDECAAAAADAPLATPATVEAARAAALERLSRSGVPLRHSRLLADVFTRRARGVQAAADECAKEGRWF